MLIDKNMSNLVFLSALYIEDIQQINNILTEEHDDVDSD